MAMASVGIPRISSSNQSAPTPKPHSPFLKASNQSLSSSSCSSICGEKINLKAALRKTTSPNGRKPMVVSPRAVSDSKNSQTCLDPDASRSVLGIILGGGAGTRLYPLTKKRAKPAVPLGANYRLIDIPVSNCLNSNVSKIYVLTQFNSASLNRHLSRAYTTITSGQHSRHHHHPNTATTMKQGRDNPVSYQTFIPPSSTTQTVSPPPSMSNNQAPIIASHHHRRET